jgi:stage III sporulation protein AF
VDLWKTILMLAVIEIMHLILHMLLPEGSIKKYASFVIGLLVIYTLLGPIVQGIRLLDERLASFDANIVTHWFERIEWEDYIAWYLNQSPVPVE